MVFVYLYGLDLPNITGFQATSGRSRPNRSDLPPRPPMSRSNDHGISDAKMLSWQPCFEDLAVQRYQRKQVCKMV